MLFDQYKVVDDIWNEIYFYLVISIDKDIASGATNKMIKFIFNEDFKLLYLAIGKALKQAGIKNKEARETILKTLSERKKEILEIKKTGINLSDMKQRCDIVIMTKEEDFDF